MKTTIVDIHKINHQRPAFDLYIGRAVRYTEFTKSSKWFNPYRKTDFDEFTLQYCLEMYEKHIRQMIRVEPNNFDLKELVGKRLGCWCLNTDSYPNQIKDFRCHGQILLKLIHEMGLE